MIKFENKTCPPTNFLQLLNLRMHKKAIDISTVLEFEYHLHPAEEHYYIPKQNNIYVNFRFGSVFRAWCQPIPDRKLIQKL